MKRSLDSSLHRGIKRMAAEERTTTVVLLVTALKTLLYRLTNQTDLVVGVPVSGQAITGQSCLVGHCVNLVPVRSQLQPGSSFRENLAAVKRGVLDAYDHQQCTIGSILQHLSLPRVAGHPPLIEVIFNVDRDPGSSEFHGVEFSYERNPKRALHFDLFLNFVEGPRGLYVECDYNTELFDVTTIERWLKHFQTLLENIIENPAETLGKLPILTNTERQQLLVEWNNQTRRDYPKDLCIHEIIEVQAESTPEAVAVIDGERRLTYRELNQRANVLAMDLRSMSVGPEVLVGVCAERSVDMVVALLGILKAGGGYVPLDPRYPQDRIAFMLEDTRAPVLITQRRLALGLPSGQSKVIYLDEVDWKKPGDAPKVRSGVKPANLAYVIYTSGSTGKPKGVAIEHRSAVVLMYWAREVFAAEELAGILFSTSICFDLSVYELFVALGSGGRVIVAQNALELPNLPAKNEVTLINTVPSAMTELVRLKAVPPSVRVVNLAGEPLKTSLVDQIYALGTVKKVYDLYGPSEDTTYSTGALRQPEAPATIGRPIANTQVYILDSNCQPVPIGVAGEIYLGGQGLARGYLNLPELTDEKFIENRFSKESSPRLYRTGDLARYRPDGNIEFLGRIDHQVKIRGFRIELGEIETVLSRHAAVKQCVVVACKDSTGNQGLVAYVEPLPAQRPATNDLREHLKTKLPEYMVPPTFIIMEKLPLTPNGKIDRRALPKAENIAQQQDGDYVAPRDALELQLVQLWAKVLGSWRVGIHDNFFDLGGHSILAVRILVEIEKICNKRLPLATLLQSPTIAELAEVLRKENWKPSWSSLVPIRPGGARPPLFLMHSHGGNVLEYYPLANLLGNDQPVYALQARGLEGRIVRNPSIEEMAAAYLEEMKSLQPKGPYFLGGFCLGGLLALEAAQQLCAIGEEVALLILIQSSHPAYPRYKPGTTFVHRWWHRVVKRVDLEQENFSHLGRIHVQERCRRIWDIARAKVAIAADNMRGNGSGQKEGASVPYILESLSIEHEKAYCKYEPGPYYGEVALFRASKQLKGIIEDPYLGWRELLRGPLHIGEAPGHQQNILLPPNVARLARQLTERLEATQP